MTHERLEVEDNAVAVIRFKSGALGVIQGSTSIQPAQPRHIELHGHAGTIVIHGDEVGMLKEGEGSEGPGEKGKSSGASSPLAGFSPDPHRFQFEAIAEAIHSGKKPPVSGKDSLRSLAIVMGIYQSAATNLLVNMDDLLNA
jgi:predicted dehydrogenase